MSKIVLITVLLLLFAAALNQRSKRCALLGVFAVGLCLSHAQAQSKPDYEKRDHESRFDLALNLTGLAGSSTHTGNAGLGVRATYHVTEGHFFALDAEVNHFSHSSSAVERGGALTQVLIGPRINFMVHDYDEHIGPFNHFWVKVRPGFVSWSNAIVGLGLAPPVTGSAQAVLPTRFGRATMPALDAGISLEAPLGNGFAWHLDAGNTFIYTPELRVASSAIKTSGGTKSNFQASTGLIYRF